MHRGYRYLSLVFLVVALAAPIALTAASPQDDKDHDRQENSKRYYDKHHKDYHNWDSREDREYQRYQSERHEKRDFAHLNSRHQNAYWNWRHHNPDNH